jgi:hypothetical protein
LPFREPDGRDRLEDAFRYVVALSTGDGPSRQRAGGDGWL